MIDRGAANGSFDGRYVNLWMPAIGGPQLNRRANGGYTLATMLYYAVKVIISALLIVAISEIAKRSTGFAALIASIPLTSLLAFIWLHVEGAPPERIAELSSQIFWLVIPSLLLFLLLPLLLKYGMSFWASLGISIAATVACYIALLPLLRRMGVSL